jgi:flagellar assembly protein FliH
MAVIRSVQVAEEPVVLSYVSAEKLAAAPEPLPPAPSMEIQPAAPAPAPADAPVDAPVDFDALRKQAFEDGYRDGYEAGAAEAKTERAAEAARQAEEFARLLGSAEQALAGQIEGLEDVLVEIAFAAVCKLLGESALTEEGARNLVRAAMRGVRAKEGLVVRVSPADHRQLSARTGEGRVELVADDRVALGGCIIETAGGTLDARLEVQLQQLVDTLTRARSAPAE